MKRIALLLIILSSCIKTEVLNAPIEQVDTVMYRKPHKPLPPRDTTGSNEIVFNPSVEDWEEIDINL